MALTEKSKKYLIIILVLGLVTAACYRINENRKDIATDIPVFAYHRICTDEDFDRLTNEKDLYTKVSDFRSEMKWLHDNGYRTLSMDEFYAWHRGSLELPRKAAVITFDDGCSDVIDNALPIMKQYDIKATMFVIGALTGEGTDEEIDGLRYISRSTIKRVTEEYPQLDFQSHTNELHKYINDAIAIYSSTYEDMCRDAEQEKAALGRDKVEFMAYPYGYYTTEFVRASRGGGIKMAFTYNDEEKATRDHNPYLMPRIAVKGDESVEDTFIKWLK